MSCLLRSTTGPRPGAASVFGSFSSISYGGAGNALLTAMANNGLFLTGAGVATAGSFNGTGAGNFDISMTQIGTRTAWTPVQNLTLSAEFLYSRLHQNPERNADHGSRGGARHRCRDHLPDEGPESVQRRGPDPAQLLIRPRRSRVSLRATLSPAGARHDRRLGVERLDLGSATRL